MPWRLWSKPKHITNNGKELSNNIKFSGRNLMCKFKYLGSILTASCRRTEIISKAIDTGTFVSTLNTAFGQQEYVPKSKTSLHLTTQSFSTPVILDIKNRITRSIITEILQNHPRHLARDHQERNRHIGRLRRVSKKKLKLYGKFMRKIG